MKAQEKLMLMLNKNKSYLNSVLNRVSIRYILRRINSISKIKIFIYTDMSMAIDI